MTMDRHIENYLNVSIDDNYVVLLMEPETPPGVSTAAPSGFMEGTLLCVYETPDNDRSQGSVPTSTQNDENADTQNVEARAPSVQSSPQAFIDLSNVATPINARRSTPYILDTIDLCTPEETPRSRLRSSEQQRRMRLFEEADSKSPVNDGDTSEKNNHRQTRSQPAENKALECPVCMENLTRRQPTSTKCGHLFCKSCIRRVVQDNHKCPLCNKRITSRDLFRIFL